MEGLEKLHPDTNYYGSCTLTSIWDLENYTLTSVPLSVHISITLQFSITNITSVADLKVFWSAGEWRMTNSEAIQGVQTHHLFCLNSNHELKKCTWS